MTAPSLQPQVLVIQPDALVPLDQFATWLVDAGINTQLVQPFDGDPVPNHLDHDGLLVLGGSMSAYDDHQHPWLADIRALLRTAVEQQRPVLGICLGGQLLAQACGGEVSLGDRGLESGLVRLRGRPEARTDVLLGQLPAEFVSTAMHSDMVNRLPEGAVWLADGTDYPHQAFAIGNTAWGLQFHPEVSLATYQTWVEAAAEPGSPLRHRLEAQTGALVGNRDVQRAGRHLVQAFGAIVTARTSTSADGPA